MNLNVCLHCLKLCLTPENFKGKYKKKKLERKIMKGNVFLNSFHLLLLLLL